MDAHFSPLFPPEVAASIKLGNDLPNYYHLSWGKSLLLTLIKNTSEFITKMGTSIPYSHKLVSFDVTRLFTNVSFNHIFDFLRGFLNDEFFQFLCHISFPFYIFAWAEMSSDFINRFLVPALGVVWVHFLFASIWNISNIDFLPSVLLFSTYAGLVMICWWYHGRCSNRLPNQ